MSTRKELEQAAGGVASTSTETSDDPHQALDREDARRQSLPKRFYSSVDLGEHEGGHVILLDGRRVNTPKRAVLVVSSEPLAIAIRDEWTAQDEVIDPASMPLTKLLNTALDGVAAARPSVVADAVRFAGNDMLLYRAEAPEALTRRQADLWDPVLLWAYSEFGAAFTAVQGIMPVEQPEASLVAIRGAFDLFDDLELTAAHVTTTLTGSALLALGHLHGFLDAEKAWALAHVDEDWQIAQWGEDAEARAVRDFKKAEFDAASRFVSLHRAARKT